MNLSIPVLFLVFNRPDATARSLERIRLVKPSYLYVAADGPRTGKEGEIEKCELVRKLVLEGIDWECEIKTLMRPENLGCGKAVSTAITWFFEQVEAGIILEDDCLADGSFFYFCEELLQKYKDTDQVMHIGGFTLQPKNVTGRDSYYFSNYVHVWGWATWRRAWQLYSFNIPADFYEKMGCKLRKVFSGRLEQAYWKKSFESMTSHAIDTWDIQWSYSVYAHSGIGITPAVNLVSNIGFGPEAAHTRHFDPKVAGLPVNKLAGLRHPVKIKPLKKADRYTFKTVFQQGDTGFNRIKFQIGKRIPLIKKIYLKLFK